MDMSALAGILVCIGFWLAISWVLACTGGWRALAKRYRNATRRAGKLFPFASVGMRLGVGYGNCVFVRVDSEGIGVSVFPLFRFFHPKLFIPWSAISGCRCERTWDGDYTVVDVSEPTIQMRFSGKLGRAIYETRDTAC